MTEMIELAKKNFKRAVKSVNRVSVTRGIIPSSQTQINQSLRSRRQQTIWSNYGWKNSKYDEKYQQRSCGSGEGNCIKKSRKECSANNLTYDHKNNSVLVAVDSNVLSGWVALFMWKQNFGWNGNSRQRSEF